MKLENKLWQNGVRLDPYSEPPKDLAAVEEYLDKDRDSQPANEEDWKDYLAEITQADNKDTVMSNVWPLLAKKPRNRDHFGYNQNMKFQWTEVDSAITANISNPKPDISESFRHRQYPLEAVEYLGPALAPTEDSAAMPRFCIEVRGLDGAMAPATKLAAYHGAVMVEAALEAHQYMSKPANDFFGYTQALTAVVSDYCLEIYANHAIPSPQTDTTNNAATSATAPYPDKFQYHHFLFEGVSPSRSLKDFQMARKRVRNAQDWAREKAAEIKDALHAHVDAAMHATTTAADPTRK